MKERVRKTSQRSDVLNVKSWVIMQMNARMMKTQVCIEKHVTFAMMCCEKSEEEKYENGEEENKQESKNPDDDERKVDPGTARNTEEPQGIPLTQLYISNIFMTGIMSEWAMSIIEDNLETPRDPSSVQEWRESSKQGQEEKS